MHSSTVIRQLIQQPLIRDLSVEAAQAVTGESTSVLPTLEALNQASLLQPQVSTGETRFVMLETLLKTQNSMMHRALTN